MVPINVSRHDLFCIRKSDGKVNIVTVTTITMTVRKTQKQAQILPVVNFIIT